MSLRVGPMWPIFLSVGLFMTYVLQAHGKADDVLENIRDHAENDGTTFTFFVKAFEVSCFYEPLKQGTPLLLEYQVVSGGNLDIDLKIKDPKGVVFYQNERQKYGSYNFVAKEGGDYEFCFSNAFSAVKGKLVYIDVQPLYNTEIDDFVLVDEQGHIEALNRLESLSLSIHSTLRLVNEYHSHARVREWSHQKTAKKINKRIPVWTVGESLLIIGMAAVQVVFLRTWFQDRSARKRDWTTLLIVVLALVSIFFVIEFFFFVSRSRQSFLWKLTQLIPRPSSFFGSSKTSAGANDFLPRQV